MTSDLMSPGHAELSQELNKIYIGQLPLTFEQAALRDIFARYVSVADVKIIKGDNTRGRYDHFCFAFVTLRASEKQTLDIIDKVHSQNPQWRMNIKYDGDRQQKSARMHQQPSYERHDNNYDQRYPPHPIYQQHAPQQFQLQLPHQAANQRTTETIVGDKPQNILVRQLWLGGIPENFDKMYMHHIMSHFGLVEEVEIFPKFAFVKFKMVEQATLAFQRADTVCQMLGNPQGFRIFFSDPSRRKHIVSNHYQFDRHSIFVPILFLGFHPITSAVIDLQHLKQICERFGPILSSYMRRNTNTQNRSYFLFTYDSLKTALRAKTELCKRRDMLGDKRVEVTLLLDEQSIIKGRDFSFTMRMYQGELADKFQDKRRRDPLDQHEHYRSEPPRNDRPDYYRQTPHTQGPPSSMPNYPGMYANPNMYPMHFAPSPFYPQPSYYTGFPGADKEAREGEKGNDNHNDVHDLLNNVLGGKEEVHESKPSKQSRDSDELDIIRKLLGDPKTKEKDQREPSWSGFLTWRGVRRVGVDGHCSTSEPEEYAINIVNLIDPQDMVLKEKNVMVVSATNAMSEATFKDYIRNLRTKVGVSLSSSQLMYVMAKSPHSEKIERIKDSELLVVLEKCATTVLIRDKLLKCEEME